MKSVLRSNESTQSVGFSNVLARGAAVAALALTMSGCSTAEGAEQYASSGAAQGYEAEAPTSGSPTQSVTNASNGTASNAAASNAAASNEDSAANERGATPVALSGTDTAAEDADSSGAADADEVAEGAAPSADAPVASATMHTDGRRLLDSCGNTFVVRGVEQIFGNQLPQGNDWVGLIEQIASAGVNAVRILASTDTLSTQDVDALLDVVAAKGMAAYITPYGDEGMRWLEGQDVRQMLKKHEQYILIDAFGEPTFDDRDRFVAESTQAIRDVRSWGYRVPLTVTANQFGRDLPSLLELGEQIVAADPLHNTVLGWQAYWSQSGYYQNTYGMSLDQAVDAVSRAPFPIQLGLDRITDFPATDTADYGTLLAATAEHGVGWLWWDWFNPYGNENNLTQNGQASQLTPTGDSVLRSHPASVQNTSALPCIH